MKPIEQLNNAPNIQLEEGTLSGYQIETETYIFDFDIEIEDRYKVCAGTEFSPQTTERVARLIKVENLTVWDKESEEFVPVGGGIIDEIKSKFR